MIDIVSTRPLIGVITGLAILGATACAGDRETPLLQPDDVARLQPTPTRTAVATAEKAQAEPIAGRVDETQSVLDVAGKGVIKIANWDDKSVSLENYLVGYFFVWGFGYTVELVDLTPPEHLTALANGEIDLVLEVDTSDSAQAKWLNANGESVLNVGTLFEKKPKVRIAAHSNLKERAPELLDFLADLTPGDDRISGLAGKITSGRIGIRPNVAMLMYFKQNEVIWTQWADSEVVQGVKHAIGSNKSSLRNRSCIPKGVESDDCGRN